MVTPTRAITPEKADRAKEILVAKTVAIEIAIVETTQ